MVPMLGCAVCVLLLVWVLRADTGASVGATASQRA
jgi:hypothetical protein